MRLLVVSLVQLALFVIVLRIAHMRFFQIMLPLTSLAVVGCADSLASPTETPAVVVETVVPVTAAHKSAYSYIGRLESTQDVDLFAQINGMLARRHFKDGQRVEAGAPLFSLDDRELRAAAALAQAELGAAQAELAVAKRNLKRGRELSSNGYISRTDLDELEAIAARATGQAEAAKARLDAARTRLSYATVSAPFSGRLSDSKVDPGQVIIASQTLLANLVSIDPIRVSFHIEETLRSEVLGAAELEVLLKRGGVQYEHLGSVAYVDNRVDARSGTLKLQALFPNPEGELLPGEHVEVVLREREPRAVLMLPQGALVSDPAGDFVFVVDDQQRAQKRPVTLGARLGEEVVIEAGLDPTTQVVVRGVQHVKHGAKVSLGDKS